MTCSSSARFLALLLVFASCKSDSKIVIIEGVKDIACKPYQCEKYQTYTSTQLQTCFGANWFSIIDAYPDVGISCNGGNCTITVLP